MLTLAALIQLCIWPPSLWGKSFILSYTAVAVIAFSNYGQIRGNSFFAKYIQPQFAITIGLLPLSIYFWHQFPLFGFFVNFLAIPLFTLCIVPLSFVAVLSFGFPAMAAKISWLIDYILGCFFTLLASIQSSSLCLINTPDLTWFFSVIVLIAVYLCLLPKGFPGRKLVVIFLLPLVSIYDNSIAYGEVRVSVIDVGQGLSVLIETRKHNVLFDTGPGVVGSYSAGNSIINPYLKRLGVSYIDQLVISHPDLDHIGGMEAVLAQHDTGVIYGSSPKDNHKCRAGESWQYDGVTFKFLWPKNIVGSKNNNSCVLQVKTRDNSVLLPGDIERKAESLLVRDGELSASLLIAPHHGSKGSSSKNFIKAVSPSIVVFSTGKNNRFAFPHKDTINRYGCNTETKCLNTATSGTVVLLSNNDKWDISENRKKFIYIWQ